MTSLSVNYSSSASSASAAGNIVNLIPRTPQHDTFICVNPSGLPAGSYHVEQYAEDIANPLCNIEWALNLATSDYWVRHALTINPNTWSAWSNIAAAGAGAVTSYTGAQGTTRVGSVVALPGDLTATEVTNTPSGNISQVNVQTALNNIARYSPAPVAQVSFGGAAAIPRNVWTSVATTGFISRDTFSPAIFAAGAGPNGILDNGGGAAHYIGISLQVSITPAAFVAGDNIGVRVVTGAGGVACSNIDPADLTGAGPLIMCVQNPLPASAGVTYSVQVLNQTALANISVAGIFLDIEYLGPQ